MKITRRRLMSLTGAVAALAMPVTALAATPAPDETFKLVRSGNLTFIKDAKGKTVYLRGGSAEILYPGSADRLGALLEAVRDRPEDGVAEIRLPSERG